MEASRDFNNSRPLDVHRWSENRGVNEFIDVIHAEHFSDIARKKTKTHWIFLSASLLKTLASLAPCGSLK